ncbi:hypothetical protein ACFLT2_12230 [Acidobacteriota bacterium]
MKSWPKKEYFISYGEFQIVDGDPVAELFGFTEIMGCVEDSRSFGRCVFNELIDVEFSLDIDVDGGLGPRKPKISPVWISKEISSTALFGPKAFERCPILSIVYPSMHIFSNIL